MTHAVRCLAISEPALFPAETAFQRTMGTTIHRSGNVRFGGFKHYRQTYSGHKRHARALAHLQAGISSVLYMY